MMKKIREQQAAGNRDGPGLFRMRDGPPHVTGPPGGTGPPDITSGSTGPPQTKDPPMEWLVRKKLKRRKPLLEQTENNINTSQEVSYQEENKMKTSKRNRLLGLALAGGFSLFGATNAFAAAGDIITNTATLSYQVGGATQADLTASANFTEDRLINFTVANAGASGSAVPNATLQWVEYTITNNGNAPQGFLLTGLNNADGTADPFGGNADSFDVSAIQTFVEDGTTPGFQPADDTAAFVATIPAGSSVTVYVVSTTPLNGSGGTPLVNNDVAVMTLVAQVATNNTDGTAATAITNDDNGNISPGGTFTNGTATVPAGTATDNPDGVNSEETVFNEAAGTQDATGAPDAPQNAQTSADSSYLIQTAVLTVTKSSAALWDPANSASNPKAIPGGYVTYTVSVANAAGAVSASLTTLADTLPANLDLDPDYVTNVGPGNPNNGPGDSFALTKDGGITFVYCTGDVGDADADGCSYTGGAGGTVSIDFSAGTPNGLMPLAGGEQVDVMFNVIVQ